MWQPHAFPAWGHLLWLPKCFLAVILFIQSTHRQSCIITFAQGGRSDCNRQGGYGAEGHGADRCAVPSTPGHDPLCLPEALVQPRLCPVPCPRVFMSACLLS